MKTVYILLIALLIAGSTTTIYLTSLSTLYPHNHIVFLPGLTISSYNDDTAKSAWADESFTDWKVHSTTSKNNDSGFISTSSGGYLYYNFTGSGIGNIEIEKNLTIDTSVYKYLTVTYNASVDDRALSFSAAVITRAGVWVGLPWNHVTTADQVWVCDITDQYSGEITAIRFRLTNDYDKDYAGGTQAVTIERATIAANPPTIGSSSYNDLYTEITPGNATLKIAGGSLPSNQSTSSTAIVSASYAGQMNVDLSRYRYLNVTLRVDSPEMYARVILWTADGEANTVLMTNYAETRWHQVLIDLQPFGITGNEVSKLELGYLLNVEGKSNLHTIEYGSISFNEVQ